MEHTTNLVIISGPSGSGQDSVIAGLIDRGLPIEQVMTSVTRPRRPSESEGHPYHFISQEEFDELIKQDALAEWALVYGHKYGVTKQELERVRNLKDKIGAWKMEWHGVRTAKKLFPDILAIMIVPPDVEALADRSRERGQQSEKEIQDRIAYSQEFLRHKDLYNYTVVNEEGKLNETVDKVIDILKKEGYI